MAETQIILKTNHPFDFHSVIHSHGWSVLLPNYFDQERNVLSRVEELSSGKVVKLNISDGQQTDRECVKTQIRHKGRLSKKDLNEIEELIRHMLRLDEDMSEFYELCRQRGKPWIDMIDGKGRLLRSPGLFEDMVKVICTTNIQWGGTRRMVRELVEMYGAPFPWDAELKTFPTPKRIAGQSFEEFQSSLRLGYRAAYIYDLAVDMNQNSADYRSLLDNSLTTTEVKKRLLSIKGIGNYAAASVLMLLGRYDDVPVDSVFRQFMQEKYFAEKEFDEKQALAIYDDWGKWKYLAYWTEMIS
jgi:3-methyladenine DNA glycosylase/8-oxoguanine DNA glycosylase